MHGDNHKLTPALCWEKNALHTGPEDQLLVVGNLKACLRETGDLLVMPFLFFI